MTNKPTVLFHHWFVYRGPATTVVSEALVGTQLCGTAVDHPRLGNADGVITSEILQVLPGDRVETHNTIYALQSPIDLGTS